MESLFGAAKSCGGTLIPSPGQTADYSRQTTCHADGTDVGRIDGTEGGQESTEKLHGWVMLYDLGLLLGVSERLARRSNIFFFVGGSIASTKCVCSQAMRIQE